jgi:hypothetical protein
MGSSGSRSDYEDHASQYQEWTASASGFGDSRKAIDERATRLVRAIHGLAGTRPKAAASLPQRPTPARCVDEALVRSAITRPADGVRRVHVVLVDNSGSNRRIAEHFRSSTGYLLAMLGAFDSLAQVAFIYFSDHCDGSAYMQEVDFVGNTDEGERVLYSTTSGVLPGWGGDEPEAIECGLLRASQLDFGDAQERFLYLITDVVGHGMGMADDDGCPHDVDWRESVAAVSRAYRRFMVVGCGHDRRVGQLQQQFFADRTRVRYDHVDLSTVKSQQHRLPLTLNTVLFLMARERGKQAAQGFLMSLYEKWLMDPVFGAETVEAAKVAIRRFLTYLEVSDAERETIYLDIVAE